MVHKAQREGRWFAQFMHERSLMHEIAAVRKMKAALSSMKNDMADLGVSQEAQAALVAERIADLERLLRAGAGDERQSFAALEARFERIENALNVLVTRK